MFKRAQSGLSLIGFILFLVPVIAVAFVAMQAAPIYSEYFAIQKALKQVAQDVGPNGNRSQISVVFDKQSEIADIKAIKGSDIRVSRAGTDTMYTAEYEKRIHLVHHMWLVFDMKAEAKAQ